MQILGIETSADETSAAVIKDGQLLMSNVISSSIDLNIPFGGIVPEIAARSHLEFIIPAIDQALEQAQTNWQNIDAIAVTKGPGLGGSLLIGVMTARTLAIIHKKPLYGINHVEAHVYANFITSSLNADYTLPQRQPSFPLLALIVSGGHSQLVLFKDHGDYVFLGQTRDDAVGEAFDKVAKIIGLPYPGGPSIAEAAHKGDADRIVLPIAKMENPYDFSFSGLKTATLRAAQSLVGADFTFPSSKLPASLSENQKLDLAASFQKTAIKTLVQATVRAEEAFQPASVVIAGGVAANQQLRQQLSASLKSPALFTDIRLCTDNAAMIAANAYYRINGGKQPDNPLDLAIFPDLSM